MRGTQADAKALIKLLSQCIVQVRIDNTFRGTGFFLAPGVVATCSHVIAPMTEQSGRITILWDGTVYPVEQLHSEPAVSGRPDPYPYPDTAMLKINIVDHPWVDCDQMEPILFPEPDDLYSIAWSVEFSRDQPRLTPIVLSYEGELFDLDQNGDWRLQLREGRISSGMSGAPILNLRTGKVCAMMTRTRDAKSDAGGWAVPLARHFDLFSAVLDSAPTYICEAWNQTRQSEFLRRFSGTIRAAYRPLPIRDDFPPSLLLRTEHAAVPFLGRQHEIDDLIKWCNSEAQSSVQLLVGPGGTGKTRLAAQLCREMSTRGWITGFLSQGCKPESFDQLRETGSPVLAVFDYSDAWLGLEEFLIRLDAPEETAPPTRILLLARHSGAWWRRLVSANPYVTMGTTNIQTATSSPEELREAYLESIKAFSRYLHTDSIDSNEPIPALMGQPMLVVHMAGLLRVDPDINEEGSAKDAATQPQSAQIIASILDREEAYWQKSIAATGQRATSVLLRRVVALASLFGWTNEIELARLLTAVPDLADAGSERRHELARWIIMFYGVDDPIHQGILQPDILVERLVVLALVDCPELLEALSIVTPDHADRAFAVIDRACAEYNNLRWILERVLRSDLRRLGPLVLRIGERSEGPLREEFIRALRAAEVDFDTLDIFLSAIPPRSIRLNTVAIAICQRAVGLAREYGDKLLIAAMLERLANRLASAGQGDNALKQSLEALRIILEESQNEKEATAVPLIAQLLAVAQRTRAMRRTTEAIKYLLQAKELAQDLISHDLSLYILEYSRVLSNLTSARQALGNGDEIAKSVREEWELFSSIGSLETGAANALLATQFMQRLPILKPYVSRSDLLLAVSRAHQIRMESAGVADESVIAEVQAWRGLAEAYRTLACRDEELSAARAAEDLCRALAETDSQRYTVELAEILSFRADHAGEDREAAIDFLKEVVSLRRDNLNHKPSKAKAETLARSLLVLGQNLSNGGYHDGAIQVTEEAVNVLQRLADESGGIEYLVLARALKNLMERLTKGRMAYRAAIVAMERVAICRRLAAIDFNRYGRLLVIALCDSMEAYVNSGMTIRLSDTAQEVIKLCRRMQERADRLNLDISKILASAGLALAETGMFDDAVLLLSDAVSLRRKRMENEIFGEYAPELVRSLGYLADTLLLMRNWRKALAPADEAFAICGRLLVESPRDRTHKKRKSDTEQFYACLVRLYGILQKLARKSDAYRVRQGGLEALELLAAQGNLTAMSLIQKDLPEHNPQLGIRSPWRAI